MNTEDMDYRANDREVDPLLAAEANDGFEPYGSSAQETPSPDCESQEPQDQESPNRHSIELGKRGEDAAARFLHRRGYEILDRNWRCDAGEVDIVARDEQALVLVEVKTRMDEERGLPEEAVTADKRRRYERIAAAYLKSHDYVDVQVRFDVIGILVLTPDRALIRHHIDAFGVA